MEERDCPFLELSWGWQVGWGWQAGQGLRLSCAQGQKASIPGKDHARVGGGARLKLL